MISHIKVKFFSDTDLVRLEKTVNKFTKECEIVDIKLTESLEDWTCVVIYRGSQSADDDTVFVTKTIKKADFC